MHRLRIHVPREMKQAFTNTTRNKYSGRPLSLKGRGGVQMPICRYGAGCLYKDSCIYRHPKKTAESNTSKKICLAFVSGVCEYGNNCYDKHPPESEVEAYKEMLASKPCMYGSNCRTANCLYSHPKPIESNLNAAAEDFIPKSVMDTVFPDNVPTYSMVTPQNVANTQTPLSQLKKRKIPMEIWVNDFERPQNVYYVKDAMERFATVNEIYTNGRLALVLRNLRTRVVDLHFQSVKSCNQVLDIVVPKLEILKNDPSVDGVWIVTGTGHHVDNESHQKKSIEGESVLFFTAKNYLEHYNIKFEIGTDNSGKNGALYIST